MFVWIAKLLLQGISLYIVSSLVPGIHLDSFAAAILAVFVISLLNMFIKPVLFILTLPITVLTLGLFALVLNALMLMLAGSVLSGFTVDGFGAAFLGSIAYSLLSALLNSLVR